MAQFVQLPQSARGRLSDVLGQEIGGGLANFTGNYFASKALDRVLNDPSMKNADSSERLSKLQSVLQPYGQYGENIFKKRLQIEQQRHEEMETKKQKEQQENTRKNLSQAFGYIQKNQEVPEQILQGLPDDVQLKLGDFSRSNRVANGLYHTMVSAGVPADIAKNQSDIIRSSEKGTGQTYAIQGANDLINRFRNIPESEPFAQNIGSGKFSNINPEFEFPLPEKVEGLTLKERAAIKNNNTQQNLKDYNENRNRKRNLEEDKFSFQKLQELNPKISTGIAKWNIDPRNGEIILPALATPEERQFAKLIVRQLRNAKDTYGARVTNFDAAKYLEGFPSLGDSPEAREAILKDLQIVNELNLLHSEAMDEVYRTYKPGEISPQQAEQIGDDIVRKQTQEIWGKFTKVAEKESNKSNRPPLESFFE